MLSDLQIDVVQIPDFEMHIAHPSKCLKGGVGDKFAFLARERLQGTGSAHDSLTSASAIEILTMALKGTAACAKGTNGPAPPSSPAEGSLRLPLRRAV